MSDFNLIWRRYNLKCNPYFMTPLTIDGGLIDLSNFVGRDKEIEILKRIIKQGGVRSFVVGDSGVGKTSLVNFVRDKASKEEYFTTQKEIELNKPINSNEFIIITLSAIYDEFKRRGLNFSPELTASLDALYSLTQLSEFSEDNLASVTHLNYNKLFNLFRKVIEEVKNPRFKGIILHYDNLDNIRNPKEILRMFGEIRDILISSNDVTFFFVGNRFLPRLVSLQTRVRQIFLMPETKVAPLTFEEIKKVLDKRIDKLKLKDGLKPIMPHTEKALKILFELHDGNLREILNSLSNCVIELPPSNTPIRIDEFLVRDLLFQKVKKAFLSRLTEVEREILFSILDKGVVTPSEIADLNKKSRQNMSSKYLPKLESIGAIEYKGSEGRNIYYSVAPEIRWWKLEMKEDEKRKAEEMRRNQTYKIIEKKLSEFF